MRLLRDTLQKPRSKHAPEVSGTSPAPAGHGFAKKTRRESPPLSSPKPSPSRLRLRRQTAHPAKLRENPGISKYLKSLSFEHASQKHAPNSRPGQRVKKHRLKPPPVLARTPRSISKHLGDQKPRLKQAGDGQTEIDRREYHAFLRWRLCPHPVTKRKCHCSSTRSRALLFIGDSITDYAPQRRP